MGEEVVRGEVIPFESATSVESVNHAKTKVARAKRAELREARRVSVEEGFSKGLERMVGFGLETVLIAADQIRRARDSETGEVDVSKLDDRVQERGMRAMVHGLDRAVGKPTARVEGELVHEHLFSLLAERMKLERE